MLTKCIGSKEIISLMAGIIHVSPGVKCSREALMPPNIYSRLLGNAITYHKDLIKYTFQLESFIRGENTEIDHPLTQLESCLCISYLNIHGITFK